MPGPGAAVGPPAADSGASVTWPCSASCACMAAIRRSISASVSGWPVRSWWRRRRPEVAQDAVGRLLGLDLVELGLAFGRGVLGGLGRRRRVALTLSSSPMEPVLSSRPLRTRSAPSWVRPRGPATGPEPRASGAGRRGGRGRRRGGRALGPGARGHRGGRATWIPASSRSWYPWRPGCVVVVVAVGRGGGRGGLAAGLRGSTAAWCDLRVHRLRCWSGSCPGRPSGGRPAPPCSPLAPAARRFGRPSDGTRRGAPPDRRRRGSRRCRGGRSETRTADVSIFTVLPSTATTYCQLRLGLVVGDT